MTIVELKKQRDDVLEYERYVYQLRQNYSEMKKYGMYFVSQIKILNNLHDEIYIKMQYLERLKAEYSIALATMKLDLEIKDLGISMQIIELHEAKKLVKAEFEELKKLDLK